MKNSNWILAFLIALPLTTLAADNTGLVLRLSLNDPYALVAIDSSGLANDGQLAGQVYLQPDPLMGGAANFYGPTGAIAVPYSPSLEPPRGTLQVWVKVANRQDASVVMKLTDLMVNRQSYGSRAVYDIHMGHNRTVQAASLTMAALICGPASPANP